MRKRIITPQQLNNDSSDRNCLKVDELADIEISSEDEFHPIEYALIPGHSKGWRAAKSGKQTIRLVFSQPQAIREIFLHFFEPDNVRTQEYSLSWSADAGRSFHEIVRQQWNFSPNGSTVEIEEHHVQLDNITVLALDIVPDLNGVSQVASLEQFRLR